MIWYKTEFDIHMWVKIAPNQHEQELFARAQKYIEKLTKIPGIEMIAIVNSLSMYATHEDSDIDLFIITKPRMLWFVRFIVTFIFWISWVWRHGQDIAGNFCLSFFITTQSLDLRNIAIQDDIYLYYWVYYMKPIFVRGDMYTEFLRENNWVEINEEQKKENTRFLFDVSIERRKQWTQCTEKKSHRSYINEFIRFFWLPKTLKNYEKLWKPEWIIISENMLKFHNQDRRREVRDKILQKNFDK